MDSLICNGWQQIGWKALRMKAPKLRRQDINATTQKVQQNYWKLSKAKLRCAQNYWNIKGLFQKVSLLKDSSNIKAEGVTNKWIHELSITAITNNAKTFMRDGIMTKYSNYRKRNKLKENHPLIKTNTWQKNIHSSSDLNKQKKRHQREAGTLSHLQHEAQQNTQWKPWKAIKLTQKSTFKEEMLTESMLY